MAYAHDRRALQKKAKHRKYRNCPAGCGQRAKAQMRVRHNREFLPEGGDWERKMLILVCESCKACKLLGQTKN